MTINLETEIVQTRRDAVSRMNYYTIERGGRRWTIGAHSDEFDRYGDWDDETSKRQRREHVSTLLELAMQGPADGEMRP